MTILELNPMIIKKMKPLNQMTDDETREAIALQNYLERVADIDYECYRLNISFVEFMERNLWSKMDKLNSQEENKCQR
jgi:hypothetical protein